MKKTIIAAALVAATGVANASSLSWIESSTTTLNALFNPDGSSLTYGGAGASISLGGLYSSDSGLVTYTYLGKEAGYRNIFFAPTDNQVWQINTPTAGSEPAIGSTYQTLTSVGYLNFKFVGDASHYSINGGAWSADASIGLIAQNYGGFDFIIGYNDSFNTHNDWDDMVIGVNIAPIPEPETYAMLLAGLGLMGFVARRRRQRGA